MDPKVLVEGGTDGLREIARAYREAGFPVRAIYLRKRTTGEDTPDWDVVAVVSPFGTSTDTDFILEHVALRRSGKLPAVDEGVHLLAVPADDPEARRLLEYAGHFGEPPLVLRNASWKGLSLEYVLLAEDLNRQAIAA